MGLAGARTEPETCAPIVLRSSGFSLLPPAHYRGQSLRVNSRGEAPKRVSTFSARLPGGTVGGFPSWMADPAKSSNFTVGPALTSAAALAELRKLLDSLQSNSQRGNASLKEMPREGTNDTGENTRDKTDEPAET